MDETEALRRVATAYRRAEARWLPGAQLEERDGMFLQSLGIDAAWANCVVPLGPLPGAEARLREVQPWFAERGLAMAVTAEDERREIVDAVRALGLRPGPERVGMIREPLPLPSVPATGLRIERVGAERAAEVIDAQTAGFSMPAEQSAALHPPVVFDENTILLACDGATAAGTAEVFVADETAEIGGVCTVPAYRGRGLGRELVAEAIRVAAERGCERVGLFAAEGTSGFYQALGFRPVLVERTWFSPPATAPA